MTTQTTPAAQPAYTAVRYVNEGAPCKARVGDKIIAELDGQLFTPAFEVLLVRKDHIIVRETGKKGAAKLQMPLTWDKNGAKLDVSTMPMHLYLKGEVTGLPVATDTPKKAGPKRDLTGAPTKISMCREIYAANMDKSKEEIIALFVKDAKCTPLGANTYYLTCKKG